MNISRNENRRQRLLSIRKDLCNGSSAELARKIGKDASYVARMLYEDGKPGKKNIAEDMKDAIEKAFNLPKHWLDGDQPTNKNLDPLDKIPLVRIPLLNYDQARDFRAVIENNNDLEYIAVPKDELYSAWNFALEIKDDANAIAKNPQDLTLKRGCRIIINPEIAPLPNELVVAKTDDSLVIGQLKRRSKGFSVTPMNDGYAPHDYETGQEDMILGTVAQVMYNVIQR